MAEIKREPFEIAQPAVPQKNDISKPNVTNGGKIKQKTLGKKIRDAFIADEVTDVKSYALFKVVIPAIKKTFRDLIVNVVDITLYGKTQSRSRDNGNGTYFAYNAISSTKDDTVYRDEVRGSGSGRNGGNSRNTLGVRDLDLVRFSMEEEAMDVLGYLMDCIAQYGVASVADFVSASKIDQPMNPTYNKWGWYRLDGSAVVEDPDGGWYIRMPRPRPI